MDIASALLNSSGGGLGSGASVKVQRAVGLKRGEVSGLPQTDRSRYLGLFRVGSSGSSNGFPALPLCPGFPHLLHMWCRRQSSSSLLHFPSFHILQGSSFFQFLLCFAPLPNPLSPLEGPELTATPIESMCVILRSANFSKADSSRFRRTLPTRLRTALSKAVTRLWTVEWVTEKRLMMYSL